MSSLSLYRSEKAFGYALGIMSREDESKDLNEKRFPPLSCAMAIELISTALLFAFRFSSHFVSFGTRRFAGVGPLVATY